MKGDISFVLTTVTPEWAGRMLERNTRNRPASRAHVSSLAKSMEQGRWKLNGETIKINGSALVDGQHRLMACVESGCSFESMVAYGVDESVFDTIDIGKKRSPADTLAREGYAYASTLASALPMIERYHTLSMRKTSTYSNIDTLDLIAKYPDAQESAEYAGRNKVRFLQASVVAFLHYMLKLNGGAKGVEFLDRLISGAGLTINGPIYRLRERLIDNMMSQKKHSRELLIALCVKTWNATVRDKEVQCLRWRSDEVFPVFLEATHHDGEAA